MEFWFSSHCKDLFHEVPGGNIPRICFLKNSELNRISREGSETHTPGLFLWVEAFVKSAGNTRPEPGPARVVSFGSKLGCNTIFIGELNVT